jgi:hypothetical protein
MDYKKFIESKRHIENNYGIDPIFIPDGMKDFQKYVSEYAIKKGRCAVFLDTGLGKTLIQLTVATNYVRQFNRPVLILTPLAVAFQFIKEAEKFGIDDIEYSKDGKFKSKIVVTNYERLDKFNKDDFVAVLLDESSILKNFEGAIKHDVTMFMRNVKYRFLFTATPSPNDFIELGTSSEALGYMGYTDMLSKFFTNKVNSINPANFGVDWKLKDHARKSFFEWVSTWSISMRKPSDLGYSDNDYIIPDLITNHIKIKNDNNMIIDSQIQLFNMPANNFHEIRVENNQTIEKRCQMAVDSADKKEVSVYWANLNKEADLIEKIDKNSYQIKGSMNLDKKEDILLNFSNGQIKKLITKPKITAFGLNWQHCNHTVYFPTFSYEQYYQAIRRFWRFGQKKEVIVDIIYSDGQEKIINSLLEKSKKANELFDSLNSNINRKYKINKSEFTKQITLPNF